MANRPSRRRQAAQLDVQAGSLPPAPDIALPVSKVESLSRVLLRARPAIVTSPATQSNAEEIPACALPDRTRPSFNIFYTRPLIFNSIVQSKDDHVNAP